MYWINTMTAGWLSAWLYHVPEFDYMGHWMARAMRSEVLPHVAGW